jgi:transposase
VSRSDLGDDQHFRLRDLLRYNLKTVRAYLLKEAFQQLWEYNSPAWAGKFLDESGAARPCDPASNP